MAKANRKTRLTKAVIEAVKIPTAGKTWIYDEAQANLAMSVKPTGVRSFHLVKFHEGRTVRRKIGDYPEWTVVTARQRCSKMLTEMTEGRSPDEYRQRGKLTLKDAFDHYRELQLDPHCAPKGVAEDVRRFNKHLKPWHGRPIDSITSSDLAKIHKKIGKTATTEANRVVQMFKRTFNHAVRHLGVTKANPCLHIKKYQEQTRARFLAGGELKALFTAMADDPDDKTRDPEHDRELRDFVLTCLLTGARRSNVENMAWDHLDLKRGLWTIPAAQSKNKRPMTVIIPEACVDLLKARPRRSEFVFRDERGYLANLHKEWKRLRERAGLPDVRLHDLRRSLGSWQAGLGASLPIIGASLGHQSLQATQIYARLDLEPVRASVESAGAAMLEAAGVDVADLVGTATEGE